MRAQTLECVANVSEGRNRPLLNELAAACGPVLLDLHADPDHHRSVFTLAGTGADVEVAARRLATAALARLDLAAHRGVHPRFGVLDVVPFVAFEPEPAPLARCASPEATAARDRFVRWLGATVGVPCFRYGPMGDGTERSLPEVRRRAFTGLRPDAGPAVPDPHVGACAVGSRPPMLAYNLWVRGATLGVARSVAAALRGPAVRALAFDLAAGLQVSCNLVDPTSVGPVEVHDRAGLLLAAHGAHVERCELVGLIPAAVLHRVPAGRWGELGLGEELTVESRLRTAALQADGPGGPAGGGV